MDRATALRILGLTPAATQKDSKCVHVAFSQLRLRLPPLFDTSVLVCVSSLYTPFYCSQCGVQGHHRGLPPHGPGDAPRQARRVPGIRVGHYVWGRLSIVMRV